MAKLVSLKVSDLLHNVYNYPNRAYSSHCRKNLKWLSFDDTYMIVFNLFQQKELALFLENSGRLNILYHGKPALNIVHPGKNRNTLIIFELKPQEEWTE